MTDEELSELEEFVDHCCREAVASGWDIADRVTVSPTLGECCPLGAARVSGGMTGAIVNVGYCGVAVGLRPSQAMSFGEGFDDDRVNNEDTEDGIALRAMGARFRARWLAGDYDPRGGKGGG